MEDTCRALIEMYDDMLGYLKSFKHNNYQGIFEELYAKYNELICSCADMCREAGEDSTVVIETLADALAEHVKQMMDAVPKRKKEIRGVDFNMVMAVYFVPVFTYNKDPDCKRIADHMVLIWNEKKVTPLTLQNSSYEEVVGGFKKGILCYITTAVCEYQNKPDDCYELTTLRTYRDQYLMQTEEGRQIVEEYYDIAPRIVMAIDMQKNPGDIYNALYENYLEPCIHYVEEGRNEECKELYMDMVRKLECQWCS